MSWKCLNVYERVEMVERNKDGPLLSLELSHELSMSVKENPVPFGIM